MWAKDLRVALRTPVEVALTLAAPLLLLALASWIFTGTGRDLPIALVVDGPPTAGVARLEAALTSREGEPLYLRVATRDPVEAERRLATGEVVAIVRVPAGYGEHGAAVVDVVVWNGMGDLHKNVHLSLARAVERHHETESAAPLRGAVVDPRAVVLTRPGWFAGGMVGYALMFAGFLGGGIAVAREWEEGTVRVLRTAPVAGWRLGAGKVAAGATGALAAAVVAGVVGTVTTDLRLRGDPAAAAAVVVSTAVLTASAGATLGAVARRYHLMMPLAGIGAVVLWFLGGGFSDLALARGTVLDAASAALPTTYAFRGLYAVVEGGGWPQVAPHLAVLVPAAAGAAALAGLVVHRAVAPAVR